MAQETTRQIDHPSHYNSPKRRCECIEAMVVLFGQDEVNTFAKLSRFKYCWRKGEKENESLDKDLRKAQWYQDYEANHKDPSAELWTIGKMIDIINKMFTYTADELSLKEALKAPTDLKYDGSKFTAPVSAASAADSKILTPTNPDLNIHTSKLNE